MSDLEILPAWAGKQGVDRPATLHAPAPVVPAGPLPGSRRAPLSPPEDSGPTPGTAGGLPGPSRGAGSTGGATAGGLPGPAVEHPTSTTITVGPEDVPDPGPPAEARSDRERDRDSEAASEPGGDADPTRPEPSLLSRSRLFDDPDLEPAAPAEEIIDHEDGRSGGSGERDGPAPVPPIPAAIPAEIIRSGDGPSRDRPIGRTPAGGRRRRVVVEPADRRSSTGLALKTLAAFLVLAALAAVLGYLGGRFFTGSDTATDAGPTTPSGDSAPSADPATSTDPVTSTAPAGSDPTLAPLSISLGRRQLTVEGVVPDQESADALTETVTATFGDDGSVDLAVDPGVPAPPWLDGLPGVILSFGTVIEGSLVLDDRAATLDLVVPDRRSLRRVTDALDAEAGFPPVDAEDATVTTDAAPTVTAVADDGVLTLTGAVPTSALRDAIVEAGIELYDEIDVADEIEVDTSTYATPELERFADTLVLFASLGDFEIGLDGARFHGVTEDGVVFDRDTADVGAEDASILVGLSGVALRSDPPVQVIGYADDADGAEAVTLARSRARAVAAVLVDAGVDRASITADDAGDEIDDGRSVVVVLGSSS